MGVSSYFEFVTVLFGWVVYDRLWSVLNDTGIVYVPFFVILMKNFLESRRGGDDEGSAAIQSLKKSETDVVVAIVVMFLAAVPFTEVRLGEMSYVRPTLDCATAGRISRGEEPGEVNGLATGTAYDAPLATLAGETGRIPVWWGFVHVVSKAVVAAGTAAIPCTGDVVRLSISLGGDTVEDPLLLRELADFTTDCHRAAVAKLHDRGGASIPYDARRDMDYAGSPYFLDTAGYYDVLYSRRERPAFPRIDARDAGLVGSHPTCREWWRDGANGLRARLLSEIDQATRDELVYDPNALFRSENPGATTAELEDALLRKYLAHRAGERIGVSSVSYEPDVSENYRMGSGSRHGMVGGLVHATADIVDDLLSMGAAGLGMVLQGPGNVAAGVAIREGMPIFHTLLLMVFVAVLPFLMVFSRYDAGVLVTLTLVFFGLQFFYVLWGMAFWADNHLWEALNGAASAPRSNPIQGMVSLWVQRFLYVVFPMLWLVAIGWVGVKADAVMGGFSKMAEGAAGAAKSGGDAAVGAAKAAATKGAKR